MYTFKLIIEFLNFEITPYGFWMTLFNISITNNLIRIFHSVDCLFFERPRTNGNLRPAIIPSTDSSGSYGLTDLADSSR